MVSVLQKTGSMVYNLLLKTVEYGWSIVQRYASGTSMVLSPQFLNKD